MPYISRLVRGALENATKANVEINTSGELNYLITCLLIKYCVQKGMSYDTIADCLSACEGAKLEFYRRVASPYEDRKRLVNGEVYPSFMLGQSEGRY